MADDTELRQQVEATMRANFHDPEAQWSYEAATQFTDQFWHLIEARCRRLEAERNTAIQQNTDRTPGESPAPSLWEGVTGWWLRDPCGLIRLTPELARRWQEKRKAAT